jgi:PAS domain S-box-containing protein
VGTGPELSQVERSRARSDARALGAAVAVGRRGGDLPRVLSGVAAAVLLVDLDQGRVTYANPPARALAPGVSLPVPVDRWGVAAGLRDPAGSPLELTDSPLSRVASGEPVSGEAVTVGQEGGARRLMWATGFPLEGGVALAGQALVVLLEVTGVDPLEDGAPPSDQLRVLRERAVVATALSFTISDPTQPDNPLVYVNPAFTRTTGYSAEDVLGRNCRFLQGPLTDAGDVDRLRRGIVEGVPGTVTLLNYRKDGTAFWNEVSVSPVHDEYGRLVSFVGVQADVTLRVDAEQEREAALAAEREARAEAERARVVAERAQAESERAQARLALLAEATTLLAATLDVDVALERLADLVVPLLCDWCAVDLVEDGRARRVAVSHVRPDKEGLVWKVAEPDGGYLERADTVVGEVLAGGSARLVREVGAADIATAAQNDEQHRAYEVLTPRSAMVVPLYARRRVVGALTLVAAESARRFDTDDLSLAEDLGRRAALAIDNARLYTQEHSAAAALQRGLLPALPVVPGLDLAARYLTGTDGAQVGGDWWDVLPLPDGATGLAVGDVMGHDMAAAAAMGQLRSVLRSYAWEGDTPASVLDRLDRLVQGLETAQLATVIYARLEPAPGPGGRLRWGNAGHLPPLLQSPDGSVCLLDDGASVLIGAPAIEERAEATRPMSVGSTLLLYTDGLLERRGESLDEGLARLVEVVGRHDPSAGAEELCRRVQSELTSDALDDDVALLAVRLTG